MLKTASGGGGGGGGGRTPVTANKTLYVRTPAHAVTFTNASASVGWTAHGLSVNDPVVISVLPSMGTATVTIASPGVFVKTAHGYVAGQPLRFDSDGVLPTGITAGTTYYVIAAGLTANNFEVSASPGGAAVNTSGSQSGTHYVSQVGAMPTFSTAGLLVQGTVYYVKTVVDADHVTLATTAGGTALGTATIATGLPIYTAVTGNDANDGSAADRAHAMLTMGHAMAVFSDGIDMQGFVATVAPQESVYNEAVSLPSLVGASVSSSMLTGQTSNYSGNVIIRPSASDFPVSTAGAVNVTWGLDNLTLDLSLNHLSAGAVAIESRVEINHLIVLPYTNGRAFIAQDSGVILQYRPVIVRADSGMQGYITAVENSFAQPNNVILLNAPSGAGPFIYAYQNSYIDTTFVGSTGTFTGPRATIIQGSVLTTDGFSAIPGTSNGTVDSSSSIDGVQVAGRTQPASPVTYYVGSAASAVTFTNASANIGWTAHGLSVNDPVVISILPALGTATVTIASPGVFTRVAHGYVAGQPLRTDTTGALPTGLTAGGTVYVIAAGLTADNFEVSLTPGGAAINTSGSQSGTHYISRAGDMPTFSTAGLLVAGTVYYVKTVVDVDHITLSSTAGGTALGTATVATGSPIYSAVTGNDANDGSAADRAHAMLTLQHAVDVVVQTLDMSKIAGPFNQPVTIQLADSVFIGSAFIRSIPGISGESGKIEIQGNANDFSAVTIQPDAGNYFTVYVSGNIGVDLQHLTLSDLGGAGVAQLYVTGNAEVSSFAGINFISTGQTNQFVLEYIGSDVAIFGNSVISGNAANFVSVSEFSKFWVGANVAILNTPSVTVFADVEDHAMFNNQGTYDGTMTGKRFTLANESSIFGGNGVNALPGDAVGTMDASCSYDGVEVLSVTAAKTANYTLAFADSVIPYDTTGGAFTIKLPATPQDGEHHTCSKVSTDTNVMTFDGNGHNIYAAATLTNASAALPSFRFVYSAGLGYWLLA